MRTVGRRIRPGEKHRWKCDRCNTLWDKRDLRRDGEGMWVCPQEGPGRDGATLSRGNAEALRSYVQRLRPAVIRVGQYGSTAVDDLESVSGNVLGEDGTPVTGEDDVYVLGG